MNFISFYRRVSSVFPQSLVKATSKVLLQSGYENFDSRTFLGFVLFTAVGALLTAFFVSGFFFNDKLIQVGLAAAAFAGVLVLFYLILNMAADARARKIEEILPVALQMISTNIRAGMTLENAIWSSARPEFGPFKDEVQRMSARAFGGMPLSETLKEMPERVNSQIVDRAIRLINEGVTLGGEMAHLLDQVAFDIRSTQLLQKEIAVATTTYAIFIVFAAVIASPLLFSISTYYSVLNEQIAEKQLSGNAGMGGSDSQFQAQAQSHGLNNLPGLSGGDSKKKENSITSNDIRNFSVAAIVLSSIFSSMILGMIMEGKATRGLKFAPIFIIVSLFLYFGFTATLQSAFSTLIH